MPDFLYVFRKIELLQVVDELGKSVAVKVAFGFSEEVMGLNASVNCVIRAVGDHTEMMGLIGAGKQARACRQTGYRPQQSRALDTAYGLPPIAQL